MPHTFISYVRDNTRKVIRLVRDPRLAGVEVWFDRDALKAGGRWAEAIVSGIEDGGFFLACFSKEYASRERTYMDEELAVARAVLRQRGRGYDWLVPLLLNKLTASDVGLASDPVLGALHCVAMSPDWADGIRRILTTVSPERSFGRKLNSVLTTDRPRANDKPPLLGLDFGTSHSLLAYRNAKLEWTAVQGADGRSFHPSVVTFSDNWDYWVCSEATEAASRRPERSAWAKVKFQGRPDVRPTTTAIRTRPARSGRCRQRRSLAGRAGPAAWPSPGTNSPLDRLSPGSAYRIAFGPRADQKVLTVQGAMPRDAD